MNKEPSLFPDLPLPDPLQPTPRSERAPRLLVPQRNQIELRPVDLEATLASEHPARNVWAFVEGLDLSALYTDIGSVEGHAGRAAIDPRILTALWLYATIDGVGSAREIERLTQSHDAYRWICGGVNVNHHTLSDFRCARPEVLEGLLTHSVAVLLEQGLVQLDRVAQDGMRVRAGAGAASFRRRSTLAGCLEEAEQQIEALRAELDADPQASQRRRQAAQLRAAEQRTQRVSQALQQLADIEQRKKKPPPKKDTETEEAHAKRTEPRASSTDPEARVMKMADGGFRPAYNVQFATTTDSQVIVGVEVCNSGSDLGQLAPMLDQVQQRYGQEPEEWIVDGGYPRHSHGAPRRCCCGRWWMSFAGVAVSAFNHSVRTLKKPVTFSAICRASSRVSSRRRRGCQSSMVRSIRPSFAALDGFTEDLTAGFAPFRAFGLRSRNPTDDAGP